MALPRLVPLLLTALNAAEVGAATVSPTRTRAASLSSTRFPTWTSSQTPLPSLTRYPIQHYGLQFLSGIELTSLTMPVASGVRNSWYTYHLTPFADGYQTIDHFATGEPSTIYSLGSFDYWASGSDPFCTGPDPTATTLVQWYSFGSYSSECPSNPVSGGASKRSAAVFVYCNTRPVTQLQFAYESPTCTYALRLFVDSSRCPQQSSWPDGQNNSFVTCDPVTGAAGSSSSAASVSGEIARWLSVGVICVFVIVTCLWVRRRWQRQRQRSKTIAGNSRRGDTGRGYGVAALEPQLHAAHNLT